MSEWLVRVDVGGTFTDGWACSPDGEELRCKVLSSGIIRSRVLAVEKDWIVCERPLSSHPSGLEGFQLKGGGMVLESRPSEARLKLDREFVVGETIELVSGEDAPLVAARLLTGTAVGRDFPAMELRAATTRGTNALLEGKGEPVTLITNQGFESLLEIRDQRRPDLFELAPAPSIPVIKEVIGLPGRLDRNGDELEALDLRPLDQLNAANVALALINADVASAHENEVAKKLRENGVEVSVSHELAPVIRLWPRMETAVANAYLNPVMGRFIEGLRDALPNTPLSLMTSSGQLRKAEDFRPIDSLLSGPAGGVAGALALARSAGLENVLTFDMGGTSTDVARIAGEPGYRYEQEIGPVKVLAPAVKIETVAAGGGSICQWRNGGLEVGPESAGSDPGPACYGRGGPLTVTDVNLLLGLMDEKRAGIPLDRQASQKKLDELCQTLGAEVEQEELLQGLRQIAVEHMAEALRQVSTRDGYDCRDHALIAFGGAGPQHACALARELGMTTILIPSDAGLLSAWGLHQAGNRELRTRQILKPLVEIEKDFFSVIDELGGGRTIARCLHELRLQGQDSCLEIETDPDCSVAELVALFESRYRLLNGDARPADREVEWVTARVELAGDAPEIPGEEFDEGEIVDELLLEQDAFSTLVIESGWRRRRGSRGSILLTRELQPESQQQTLEVIEEELYRRRFESVVEEMGILLKRTALSTNIKERLDYSCALLDSDGYLVVNAPHIPVHLGALGLCVREVSKTHQWFEGDTIVVNHPGFGGSHLPDVTVISPIFSEGCLIAFVANRAHHAEIGGITPGSMPPNARCLAEEGIVIAPTLYSGIGAGFFAGSRMPRDNEADLAAQVTANQYGVKVMQEVAQAGPVLRHMKSLYQRSAAIIRKSIGELKPCQAEDQLDDGSTIKVSMIGGDKLTVDFRGSEKTHPGNLNATPAIVRSAVLYALQLWVGEDLPLNEGLLESVEILTEEGILNPPLTSDPESCPAVVGGNVETSQRVVDVLLTALGIQSNGQGTMNNFLFGNERFGFYETMGGGAGAGPGWHGRSACHVHMSNTAITDVEVLEERYPVRVREFQVRKGSGGEGSWRGGDGLIREIEFLEEMTVSLLTQRRTQGPRPNGTPGRQSIFRNGTWAALPGIASVEVGPGDRIRIETPGGGAWS
ncbi:hydantoinase B/oxoprolinase family protein [Akkermansiaceae bacterium]|nr:hydantoinase B/oxoprolinase family protein [Akkermansiaceae bacterium]MDB4537452.1 hydantoinase B/oxoprolinase family protein [Akkermansiaceae bacterium]